MSVATAPLRTDSRPQIPWAACADLFLISVVLLFLELACIRWFPAHVLFLTFFTNTILLACFLGMSVGCLAARRPWNWLPLTALLLPVALGLGVEMEALRDRLERVLDVAHQASPQLIFFGTEYKGGDVARFPVPIEVIGGGFFVLVALALVGPGQELGRALGRVPDRLLAYSVNILGSLAGIVLFAACSWWQLPPLWWFGLVALGLAYFLLARGLARGALRWAALAGLVLALYFCSRTSGAYPTRSLLGPATGEHYWSPYYRIDYVPQDGTINANLIGYQQMTPRQSVGLSYGLPHMLHRDAGGKPFEEVLIIGAGSGNDVSRALQWGARHIDAVEIDPVIQGLGRRDHPDHPYDDPRVTVHLQDGRNFLRSTQKKYDLVIYALVDSLVLHSSYSNIRLESYLFTRQAFESVRDCLKPDGIFVMSNYFRQGWVVARLDKGLEEVFGARPLVLTVPPLAKVEPEQASRGFTIFLAGNTAAEARAFRGHTGYWVRTDQPPSPRSPNGFTALSAEEQTTWLQAGAHGPVPWSRFVPAEVVLPGEGAAAGSQAPLEVATDDWPFLYLRERLIPLRPSLSGAALMAILSLLLILCFLPRADGPAGGRFAFSGRMFFLGAGFMLVETTAVVRMALLFGSTWMVNTVVFFAVLVMILAANLFVLALRPRRLWPYYAGLFAALALNALVPLDYFLGLPYWPQVLGACLLVFAPLLFAAVVFAVSFGRSTQPDRDFGANVAGAILGGLAEYSSMLLGFQYLLLVALVFYALSAVELRRQEVPAAAAQGA